MATRATIKIEGINFAKVYKHYDGYPKNMIPWLEDFNRNFTEKRGDNPEFKFAQLLRSSTNPDYNLDPSTETGYGVIPYNNNAGAEYEYVLRTDGSVTFSSK